MKNRKQPKNAVDEFEEFAGDDELAKAELKHSMANAKLSRKLAQARAQIRELEQISEHFEERLKEQAKKQFRVTKPGKASGGFFHRIIIPDSHGSMIDQQAANAFLSDLESIEEVREVVWLGDHIDCGGWLAAHHVEHYVAQTAYTFAQDLEAANQFIDEVMKRTPKAKHHYLEGNHERRISAWAVSQSQRSAMDANWLMARVGVAASLHLAQRGFAHYEQGVYYGCSVPSTIKLGKCHFFHGDSISTHAASATLKQFAGNVVFGHTHRAEHRVERFVQSDVTMAACPGSLCQLQPLWRHTSPTKWSHGYGVQNCNSRGEFGHMNISIVNGKSYLIQKTKR